MSQLTYEASVYSQEVSYRNFQGQSQKITLYFALDPIQLLESIARVPTNTSKSKNPAKQGKEQPISDEQQIKLVRDLAAKAAGFPSDDGETWEPFTDFNDSIAGKAFMTQLISSDEQRMKFAQQVFIDPFKAFVSFAEADPSNSPKEVQQMKNMVAQLENTFATNSRPDETIEERRTRLAEELRALEATSDTDA